MRDLQVHVEHKTKLKHYIRMDLSTFDELFSRLE